MSATTIRSCPTEMGSLLLWWQVLCQYKQWGRSTLNKVLKYNYVAQNKTMTVSNLATLLVITFLPASYQKYLLQNYQMSGTSTEHTTISYPLTFMEDHKMWSSNALLVQNEQGKVLTSTSCAYRYIWNHQAIRRKTYCQLQWAAMLLQGLETTQASMQTLFCSLSPLQWMGLGKTPSKLPQQWVSHLWHRCSC